MVESVKPCGKPGSRSIQHEYPKKLGKQTFSSASSFSKVQNKGKFPPLTFMKCSIKNYHQHPSRDNQCLQFFPLTLGIFPSTDIKILTPV